MGVSWGEDYLNEDHAETGFQFARGRELGDQTHLEHLTRRDFQFARGRELGGRSPRVRRSMPTSNLRVGVSWGFSPNGPYGEGACFQFARGRELGANQVNVVCAIAVFQFARGRELGEQRMYRPFSVLLFQFARGRELGDGIALPFNLHLFLPICAWA